MGWAVDENGVMYDGVDVTNRVVSSVVTQHTTQSTTKQTLTIIYITKLQRVLTT